MANQLFAGFVYTGAGVAVVGATVDLLTRNTTTPVLSTTTTDANGYWAISYATEGRFDVRITNGTSISFLKYDDQIQISAIEVATLRVRNPANTFDYDIVPAAITADRQLNLPLITATDTLAVLALAQTFSTGVKTFNSSILAIRNPADTFSYTVVASAITAARNLTIPLLTADDTLAVLALAQTFTAQQIINVSNAAAFSVGPNGDTNPMFRVVTNTVSAATGVSVTGAAAGSRAAMAVLSSGANEGLDIDAKGSGTVRFGGTSTGNIVLNRACNVQGAWVADAAWTVPAHTLGGTVTLNGQTFSGTAAGDHTYSGAITFSGASVSITGATGNTLIVDTNVLVVDATNNRVGVGIATPVEQLHVQNVMQLGTAGVVNGYFHGPGTVGFNIDSNNDGTGAQFLWGTDRTQETGGTELMRLGEVGNLKLAGTAVRATTEGTNHLDIFDGTAPVGTLANGISLYSTAGELRVMDSGGTATLLSPHDDEGYWIFDSKDTQSGRRLRIHMEKFMRRLEEHFGWGFIEEFVEV